MNASNRHHQPDANPPVGVLQLRVVVEVDDFDAAIACHRDELAMPEEFIVDSRDVSPRIRIALEVANVDTTTARMIDAGAEPVAPPTETPWRSRNGRLDDPGPIHLTLLQELDIGAQP